MKSLPLQNLESHSSIPLTMKWVLPFIVISQFFCTSLWFAGNAIMPDIISKFHLDPGFLAHLTSAVQFGFVAGTLSFAVLTISDRFSPSLVFFISSIVAGLFNLGISLEGNSPIELLLFRFLTGFFLAGIYPVGMKIASDYYLKGLGKSLGFLVGALVIGTAFPHLIKSITAQLHWQNVIFFTSALSVSGGFIILLFVPNGPYRKPMQKFNLTACLSGFRNKNFRAASIGYFGHMWELYAFWAFVPVILSSFNKHNKVELDISFLSFLIIASGGLACVFSGLLSQYIGAKKIAAISLLLSCLCCLLSPLFLLSSSISALIIFLFFWGLVVIADSPLFSTLIAQNAPEEIRGTSLTIVNCIGFSITIISIQLISQLSKIINNQYTYMLLAVGPVLGLIALIKNKEVRSI
ncbi:MFS transporter [Pedobacter sp. P351]|uniref:MFS transporter n=1 Tax=Pedobacter superstes TaxID=3133441 RepID=UPI00309A4A9E